MMKLLNNERAYLRWMRQEDGWRGVSAGTLRVYGPDSYPCWAFFDAGGINDYRERCEPSFLYLSDVEMMLNDLRKAGA